jgi:hypothetical protein
MGHTPYLLEIESLMKIPDIKISRTAVLSTLKMRLWKFPFKDYQLETWYGALDPHLEEVKHAMGLNTIPPRLPNILKLCTLLNLKISVQMYNKGRKFHLEKLSSERGMWVPPNNKPTSPDGDSENYG